MGLKPREGSLDGIEDCRTRESGLVDLVAFTPGTMLDVILVMSIHVRC